MGDEKTVDAVIRQLTIIGEAVSYVPDEIGVRAPDTPWSVICGMRNIVVHEYFGVDTGIVWKTVTRNIPELRRPTAPSLTGWRNWTRLKRRGARRKAAPAAGKGKFPIKENEHV